MRAYRLYDPKTPQANWVSTLELNWSNFSLLPRTQYYRFKLIRILVTAVKVTLSVSLCLSICLSVSLLSTRPLSPCLPPSLCVARRNNALSGQHLLPLWISEEENIPFNDPVHVCYSFQVQRLRFQYKAWVPIGSCVTEFFRWGQLRL